MVPIRQHKSLDKFHDVTKEDGISSNTPHTVGIKEKSRHRQDKGNKWTTVAKISLLKGWLRPQVVTSKVKVLKGTWACGFGFESVHMKYECSQNLVSIRHHKDIPRHRELEMPQNVL